MKKASAAAHGKPLFLAVVLLGLGAFFGGSSLLGSQVKVPEGVTQEMTLYHSLPSEVTVVHGVRPGMEVLELRTDAQWIRASLPSTWTLQQVTGVTLAELKSQDFGNQITIWTVPPRARLSFLTDHPQHLLARDEGKGSLLLTVKDLDLVSGATQERTAFVDAKGMEIW